MAKSGQDRNIVEKSEDLVDANIQDTAIIPQSKPLPSLATEGKADTFSTAKSNSFVSPGTEVKDSPPSLWVEGTNQTYEQGKELLDKQDTQQYVLQTDKLGTTSQVGEEEIPEKMPAVNLGEIVVPSTTSAKENMADNKEPEKDEVSEQNMDTAVVPQALDKAENETVSPSTLNGAKNKEASHTSDQNSISSISREGKAPGKNMDTAVRPPALDKAENEIAVNQESVVASDKRSLQEKSATPNSLFAHNLMQEEVKAQKDKTEQAALNSEKKNPTAPKSSRQVAEVEIQLDLQESTLSHSSSTPNLSADVTRLGVTPLVKHSELGRSTPNLSVAPPKPPRRQKSAVIRPGIPPILHYFRLYSGDN